MMFMMTADMAEGNATIVDVKCDAASTIPSDEFCIPTWSTTKSTQLFLCMYG